jgi:hypothetical protein
MRSHFKVKIFKNVQKEFATFPQKFQIRLPRIFFYLVDFFRSLPPSPKNFILFFARSSLDCITHSRFMSLILHINILHYIVATKKLLVLCSSEWVWIVVMKMGMKLFSEHLAYEHSSSVLSVLNQYAPLLLYSCRAMQKTVFWVFSSRRRSLDEKRLCFDNFFFSKVYYYIRASSYSPSSD